MKKLAVVTGCSRGIGRAVTEMLLDLDWAVIGLSRTAPEPRTGLYWFACDVGDGGMVEDILASDGIAGIDGLIHCAGIRGPYGPLLENDPEAWCETVQTNLIGTYLVVRACLPRLQRSEDGRILLFSGGGAFSPEPGFSAYAATKGATIALMSCLSEELRGTTVTVNAIAPGFIATSIHKGTPLEGKPDGGQAMANVVECVHHLLSPATRGLTGKTVSAQWDDFRSVDQTNVEAVNTSEMGTRDRHKIQCVRSLVRPRQLVAS